ncbi:uncharacterized protein LOC117123743 isoform X3 [Anneissia japonica]|uniref:uncharacterized protein LOC117123743 isoform X3 n=1 Tax=Anneissia japonica TaxID=1529436 RepID=UPI00142575ED|nr:uncharacterized protein LOC117123743 isoform X3 [Anneissia japonica]
MTMLDTSGSYSGDAHPMLLAYNDSNQTKGIDEDKSKTLQRTKHPSGRVYITSGRSVKAVLARRTTIPSLSSPSSPESPSEVNKRPDFPVKPSSKTSKLFLTRSQSSEKNRTFSFSASTSPSGNRNQNAVHSPEELDNQREFVLNDEVFSWISSDESDKEPQYQRDSIGRPLPVSGLRNPSFQDDGSFNQYSDKNEVSSPLNIEDLKNQEVETLQDVEQVDIQQNGSVEQNEVQGWPLLSFINSDSIHGKSFPEFEGHQHPKRIPTQPRQIPSQPFRLGQPLADKLPPVAPQSAWHHQNIHSDPDVSNEYVAGLPLLKLKQDSRHAPGLHPVQQQGLQNKLMFNVEPRNDKGVYSSIWIPPLLHLDRPSGHYQAHGNANDFPHNSENVKDMSRPVESDKQSDYDSIWVPPLLHFDKQTKDNHESYVTKHLQNFWAKDKNIHSLKLRLRGKHPHEVDPVQHIDNKDEPPDKVSMPLLNVQRKLDSDESQTRRRRRQHHRVSPKDEDSSSLKSSSSCRSDTKIQPKQNGQKPNRRKLPKEPTKRPKESKKAKDEEKKEILIPFLKNETPSSTDITLSPSVESESQPEDVLNKVKSQRNLRKKGSYDHLLEGRQESYFPSSAEVHLKAVKGIQPKQVERVDAATMATEMKNAQTSIDFDRLVKPPENDESILILDQDGKAINDAISAYTTAKTGLDNAGKVLAPDIFFNLRFERTSESQATSPDTGASQSGRNFISVVDLEGSRLLDDIPIRKQPAPEIIQHPRSQEPSIASVHYSALRNREREPSLTSPREVPEVDSPTGPDPLTKELLAARKRLNKEQFLKIKAISDEEREGYKKRMNIQLMEMDEQLKVIDEMSRQMEEDLQGTNKLMKNVETITDFLTPQQPQKKVQILDAFSDDEKKEKQDDKQRIQLLPENRQNDKPEMHWLPGDEKESDMQGILPQDKEPTVEEIHEGQERNVTGTDEEKKDDLAISKMDTTLDDTLGISGISGVSDIIAEVIVDGDLNATALGISKEQRKAARQRIQRQKINIDKEVEDLDFTSLDSKQIRELLKTPREDDDEKEPWPSTVQPSKRTEQQQKKLKEWTKKKREKAIADYRNKLGELREMEKTPFKAQNTESLKELQKAEVERQSKRNTKKEEDYDERVKHAKSLMDQILVEQTQLKTVTDKPPEVRVKKVPPKPFAKPTRAASQSKQLSKRTERLKNVRPEIYEDDRRNSRIDPEYYLKLRESFERGVPLRSSSTNEGITKRKSSLQMILEKKRLEELGKLSDLSSSGDDLDLSFENDKESQVHTPSADDAPVMYKPKPFTALVKVQRPAVTRKGHDVPRTAKTYTEMLQDLKKENINPSNKNQSIRSQQRLYGTKRLPGSSKLRGQQSPRHSKPYTQRLQEMKKMSNRPAGMRSRTPIKPPASGLTETVTLGETRRQQVERRGLKAEGKPRVSTPYTERLLQLSGTYTASEAVVSPQPKLGLPYRPKEKLCSTYVNRLKQASEGATKIPYQAVYEPVPRGTYQAYKAPPLRTPSPRHHPYRERRSYDLEDQSVSEASPWSLSDSVKRILGEDDSMAGISASLYPSDDELGDVNLDDQYSEYTLSVNIKELEEIASVGSGSILSFEWDAIDKMVAGVK